MKIGVLAVQGAFHEHENKLNALGIDYFEIRQKGDLLQEFDSLILPGGESTLMGKLLHELDLFDILHEKIRDGLPVLGTCAGLVLLASELTNDSNTYFSTIPIKVKRNAYGRQLGSFTTTNEVKHIGSIPLTFIRAPYIEWADDSVEVLATIDNHIVAVQYHNQLALAFHPEITDNLSVHSYFISLCKQNCKQHAAHEISGYRDAHRAKTY